MQKIVVFCGIGFVLSRILREPILRRRFILLRVRFLPVAPARGADDDFRRGGGLFLFRIFRIAPRIQRGVSASARGRRFSAL